MKSIDIKVDVNKLDKDRIKLVSFKAKSGETITSKDLELVIVPTKEQKVLAAGDTWELVRVGVVTQRPTKKEKEDKVKMPIVGSATKFQDRNPVPKFDRDSLGNEIAGEEEINPEDIPF